MICSAVTGWGGAPSPFGSALSAAVKSGGHAFGFAASTAGGGAGLGALESVPQLASVHDARHSTTSFGVMGGFL